MKCILKRNIVYLVANDYILSFEGFSLNLYKIRNGVNTYDYLRKLNRLKFCGVLNATKIM